MEMGLVIPYYKLTDESGSIEAQYSKDGPSPLAVSTLDDIKKGDQVRKLCILVQNTGI